MKKIINRFYNNIKKAGKPQLLTRYTWVNEILSSLDDFYVSPKANGTECVLIMKERIPLGYMIVNNEKIITLSESKTDYNFSENELSLLNCEMIETKFFVFDIIVYEGEVVVDKPLEERNKLIRSLVDGYVINDKTFVKITKKTIKECFKFKDNDGLIFRKGEYNSVSYKWKPLEENTIDFKVKLHNGKPLLFVGSTVRDSIQLSYLKRRDVLFQKGIFEHKTPYKLVLFNPIIMTIKSKQIGSSIFTGSEEFIPYDDKIVECYFSLKDLSWKIKRLREDKLTPNNIRTADSTFSYYIDPIKKNEITGLKGKEIYFTDNIEGFSNIKKFNNNIKYGLIKNNKVHKVLDIGSGRGQDVAKYINSGYHYITCCDVDSSIIELINKVYSLYFSKGIKKKLDYLSRLKLFDKRILSFPALKVYHMDFKKNPEDLLRDRYDLITMFFSAHYFTKTQKETKSFCKSISCLLKQGGRVLMTVIDPKKVDYKPFETYVPFKKEKILEYPYNKELVKSEFKQYGIHLISEVNFKNAGATHHLTKREVDYISNYEILTYYRN